MIRQKPLRILLLGYGGANNTGSEIRIMTIIDDMRIVFGSHAEITVTTVNRKKTLRALTESTVLKVVQLPYIFPLAVWRIIKSQDILVLVEGSTFKDSWSNALLYLFLWGAWCAQRQQKASIAYAVDAGRMRPTNQRLASIVCAGMDLIITRTLSARDELRALGVQREIHVTTDTAFMFRHQPTSTNESIITVGYAPVEFYEWPVRFRLWGPKERCYHWPYYFSWNEKRAAQSQALVNTWVLVICETVRKHGFHVQLIAMEELDKRICEKIAARLPEDIRTMVSTCYAGEKTPQDIVAILRCLDFLITSRYHACVLSMDSAVPQLALYHDERLISIYRELGLEHFAIPHDSPDMAKRLLLCFEQLVLRRDETKAHLRLQLDNYFIPRCYNNRVILQKWKQDTEVAAGITV